MSWWCSCYIFFFFVYTKVHKDHVLASLKQKLKKKDFPLHFHFLRKGFRNCTFFYHIWGGFWRSSLSLATYVWIRQKMRSPIHQFQSPVSIKYFWGELFSEVLAVWEYLLIHGAYSFLMLLISFLLPFALTQV